MFKVNAGGAWANKCNRSKNLQLISAFGYTMLIDRQQMAALIQWMIRKEEKAA